MKNKEKQLAYLLHHDKEYNPDTLEICFIEKISRHEKIIIDCLLNILGTKLLNHLEMHEKISDEITKLL